jgi:hypothetical protein
MLELRTLPSHQLLNPQRWPLLHAMVFAALRYLSPEDSPPDAHFVDTEVSLSRDAVISLLRIESSLENMQALAIVVFVEVGNVPPGRGSNPDSNLVPSLIVRPQ